MAYPTSLPPSGTASTTATLAAAGHTALHNNDRDEIRALATKVGTGSSTPVSSRFLVGTGSGTSGWDKVVPTGDVVGSTDSQTLTSKTLTAPTISNPTITGGGSWAGSPTLSTPTIADFQNATHDHSNGANGGAVGNGTITPAKWTNPYQFSVYRAAALTSANTHTKIDFDTTLFDTSSNVTGNDRFVAPVDGFYWFGATAGNTAATATDIAVSLYKNGAVALRGTYAVPDTAANISHASGLIQLAVGDYVEAFFIGGSGSTMYVGEEHCNFQGFLQSQT